jgi:hypothetical protein
MGSDAGQSLQGAYSVAVGNSAGRNFQGNNAVAVGAYAGQNSQAKYSVSIGSASSSIGEGSVCVGANTSANTNGVAIGLGANAGLGSITICANGGLPAGPPGGLYVNPIRPDNTQTLALGYNPTTSEIVTTTGVVPVITPSSARSQRFTIPQILNYAPLGDGTWYPFMTIYDSGGTNTNVVAAFNNLNVNTIIITMPFSVVLTGINNKNGGNRFRLLINGNVVGPDTGQFLIPPVGPLGFGTTNTYACTDLNLTFPLVRGIDYTASTVTNISVQVQGAYNYNYYANYNPDHGDEDYTTKGTVAGFV